MTTRAPWLRRRLAPVLLAGLAGLLSWSLVVAQPQSFNEFEVKSQPSNLDKSDIWSLDFRFKAPRLIKVHVPGRGTRICWYLWYQVINRTSEPRTFIPSFELVTLDFPGVFNDEVLPTVQEQIKKIEDVSGYQDLKNSVTISSKPIPQSKPAGEAFPRTITGVAIWDGSIELPNNGAKDAPKDLCDTTRFSIFISGLSNGWVVTEPLVKMGGQIVPVVERKTLQLNFTRRGDRFDPDSREIAFEAPHRWIYRAAKLRIPGQNPPPAQNRENAAPPAGARQAPVPQPNLIDLRKFP